MNTVLHLVIIGCVAALLVRRPLPSTPAAALVAGSTVALPLLGVLLTEERGEVWFGKEGVLEAFTEGGLLAAVIIGARARAWWLVAPAALLFLEEIDYGQLFLGYATPDWIAALPANRSDQVNFHNVPVASMLFRLVPLGGLVVLSRLERGFTRAGVLGAGMAALLSAVVIPLCGLRVWDESIELALVCVVLVSMRVDPSNERERAPATRSQ